MSEPVRVLVVDDQAPFRVAAKAVIGQLEGFLVIGEAASGTEAVAMAEELHPALVLMDIQMPDINGIEAARQIVAADPETAVVLCSTYEFADLPPGAAESGASAYLNKERLSTATLRRLWDDRASHIFTAA